MNADEVVAPEPAVRSAAAERMRAHRERRRKGLRCVTIELRATEINELIRKGLLSGHASQDESAIRTALHRHLDSTLTPTWYGGPLSPR
jgi:hypothetical protein